MVTPTDIVNEAIQMIGDNQQPVTGNLPNFDTSAAGKAAAQLYVPTVQAVARMFEWDMARNTVTLTQSGNPPPFPWDYEYLYPANGIEVWQIIPDFVPDPNNPLPTNWAVANTLVGGVQTKVIQTDVDGAIAVYNNNPGPDVWDGMFKEAVVRLLASKMAMAVSSKPETAENLLVSFNAFMNAAKGRDG